MAIKCLTAEMQATQYYFKYTLDDTKMQEDGTPDLAYIREWTYGIVTPEGLTDADYVDMMKRELPLLAQAELDAMNPQPAQAPTPLAGF